MVNRENYEEYMILYADGELDTLGVQQLKDFISKNPELYDELAMYQQLRMVPDEGMVYTGKEELLKKPVTRIFSFPLWQRYSAAAAILLLVCFTFYKYGQRSNEVKIATAATIKQPDTAQTVIRKQESIHPPVVVAIDNKHAIAAPVIKKQVSRKTPVEREANNSPVVIASNTSITELQKAEISPAAQTATVNTITVPATAPVANKKENNNLFAKLPLSPGKVDVLNDIKSSVAGRLEQIQNFANDIKDTRVVIRIGQKQIDL